MGVGSARVSRRRSSADRARFRVHVEGVVQGVGFRPFVYALARELALSGSVGNTDNGVIIEVEGASPALAEFVRRLESNAPPLARIVAITTGSIPVRGGTEFRISGSHGGAGRTLVSPDVATCAACLAELADPTDRRYRHPFISCTNCGPRFTIIVDLPYDRPATTMRDLPLCPECAAEYGDPADRRFHAQTVACPECGPTLALERPGDRSVVGDGAVAEARRLLGAGAIVAVKGLGGYHLACNAYDRAAVAALRKRKDRGDKPFAVMVPDPRSAGFAEIGPAERELLTEWRRPVVIVPKSGHYELAPEVAPDSPDIGVLVAYTPLHTLLFGLPGDPPGPAVLVMTSGNLAGEPIVTDDRTARTRLAAVADAWLSHDRPIHVPCDDSVVRIAAGAQLPVRRSRGYAPLPVALPIPVRPALAVGGDVKNTFCVGTGRYAWMSAHVGDMDDLATLQAFETATAQLRAITRVRPEVIVADRHPGYRSAAVAKRWVAAEPELILRTVQHHHAHVASAMAENGHDGSTPVIGVAFDGTGYGEDGAVWGGEVLVADYRRYERVAHLRYVALPGGDAGVRNPCRMALSHLRSAGIAWDERLPCVAACSAEERRVLDRQLTTGLRCAPTSSMGRLFDAMSSLAGVCHRVLYEAEAAMRFEGLARAGLPECGAGYEFAVEDRDANAAPVVAAAAADVLAGTAVPVIAARFHIAVADLVATLAGSIRDGTGIDTVALTGGVFLNALLTALCVQRLQDKGFHVLRHRVVPPSDAGLALGQLAVAARVDLDR
jgi:hydrogenase maturation protein HypF